MPPLGLIGQGLQVSEIAFKLILPLAIGSFPPKHLLFQYLRRLPHHFSFKIYCHIC